MYRAGLESILGFHLQGNRLRLEPCIPAHWPRFEIVYRHHATRYEIVVENPDGVSCGVRHIDLDGVRQEGGAALITLIDDGGTHRVRVILGPEES
jgi:cyclic beta-1,2-glucan synthetase